MLTTDLIRARDADRALFEPLCAALWSIEHPGCVPSQSEHDAYLAKARSLATALEHERIALLPLFQPGED